MKRQQIPIANISLDRRNPRLSEDQNSERDALRELASRLKVRLLNLAEDLLNRGPSPMEVPGVIALPDEPGRYWVVEGNRRVAAVKAMEHPEHVLFAFGDADKKRWRSLHERFQQAPIDSLECVVFPNEEEAAPWVELRHEGAQEGRGLVPWGSEETERWRRRRGRGDAIGELLQFAREHGRLSPEASASKKGILTSFKRLLNTPEVRQTLGVDLRDGRAQMLYPLEEVAKALGYVVDRLLTSQTTVRHIYEKDQRVEFAQAIPKEYLPDPSRKLSAPVPLAEAIHAPGKGSTAPPPPGQVGKKPKEPAWGDAVVPKSLRLRITDTRAAAIFKELRELDLSTHRHSASVMLRVFLELSVDAYLEEKGQQFPHSDNTPLAKRMKKAADVLHAGGSLTHKQLRAVGDIADTKRTVGASITTMNRWVHNQFVFPTRADLVEDWKQLQPLVKALWPS